MKQLPWTSILCIDCLDVAVYVPSDWEGILPVLEHSETIYGLVPNSCCAEFGELLCDVYFMSGCLHQLHSFVGSKIAAGVHILIILIVMLGFFFYNKFVRRTTLAT